MKQILVAEDKEVQLELLIGFFRNAGYAVQSATNGKEALRILDEIGNIHIVHTDIEMPNMDGYGLITGLTQRGLQIPVIVCSSKFDPNEVSYSGSIEFIPKPCMNLQYNLEKVIELIGPP